MITVMAPRLMNMSMSRTASNASTRNCPLVPVICQARLQTILMVNAIIAG